MTDDFHLFADPDDGEGPLDPDVALVCAYLARELSPMQVLVLEERLATDTAFRAAMQPLIDAWAAPVPSLEGGQSRRVAPLTAIEKAERWRRFQQETPTDASITPAATRTRSMTRIAAVIAMILLPLVTFAQIARYVVTQRRAPGPPVSLTTAPPPVQPAPAPAGGEKRAQVEIATLADSTVTVAQPRPVRLLGAVIATAPVQAAQMVALSDGRVLVGDALGRQVQLFDSSLAARRVLDTVTPPSGGRGMASVRAAMPLAARSPNYLIPFRGDSSLWWNEVAHTFAVVDPAGRMARTLVAYPFENVDAFRLHQNAIFAWPSIPASSALGLIYGVNPPRKATTAGRAGTDSLVPVDDSIRVVRMNFDTRVTDTLARLAMETVNSIERYHPAKAIIPADMRFVDDLVTTSDGSVVILRAREYRLDWITPDGARTSQALSYPWRKLSEEKRRALADTINALAGNGPLVVTKAVTKALDFGGDTARPTRIVLGPGRTPTRPSGTGLVVEVPEVYAAVPVNALRADGDGNVWIKQILAVPDPAFTEWEIVSRTRGVIDRVRIPVNRTIVGFGRGMVYLSVNDGGGARLEKVRVK